MPAISDLLSAKSKMAAFSDSRSTLLVRGMTTMSCWTRKRKQIWAAVFLQAAPMAASVSSPRTLPLAIGL
jgi:hypothetical protein